MTTVVVTYRRDVLKNRGHFLTTSLTSGTGIRSSMSLRRARMLDNKAAESFLIVKTQLDMV